VWAALIREVGRVQRIYHRLHDETLPAPTPDTTFDNEYYMDLIEALSQSRDPVVIPLLVEAAGRGKDATDGFARFGDLAIPPLVAHYSRYLK